MTADLHSLARDQRLSGSSASAEQVAGMARKAGFTASVKCMGRKQLPLLQSYFPALALLRNGNTVILHGFIKDDDGERVLIVDPLAENSSPFEVSIETLEANWDGTTVILRPRKSHPLLRSFVLVARHRGVDLSEDTLISSYAVGNEDPPENRFIRIAAEQGFKVQRKSVTWEDLRKAGDAYPLIAPVDGGGAVIITGMGVDEAADEELLDVLDPYSPHFRHVSWDKRTFEEKTGGETYLVKRVFSAKDSAQPFGLRWFLPEFLKRKREFMDVALAAIFLQVLALAMPLYFQIVVDKVLVHHGISTLQMLGIGMLIVIFFEFIFSFFRGYIMVHATSKIDIRVATRTFSKLLELPLTFFDRANAGVLIKHMQQADQIRQFLSGKLFFTILDSFALVVLLPLLFFYSVELASVVLGFSLLIALVIALLIRPFRKRLTALYNAEGERQSHLVETIQGMKTVKSLALEPQQRNSWDQKAANAVKMNFKVGRISVSANSLTSFLEKLMSLGIPWIGVYLVFEGNLTIGSLVAFQMLAGRVSSPLVQIVTMVNEYQETALSIRMLGSIMNQQSERGKGTRGLTPDIAGNVEFENVGFRYVEGGLPVLVDVNLNIPAGTLVGVVGRSGSGKSTLVRLLSGLYPCQEGMIRLDGYDVREIDLGHLRRSVGMVLQDNFLFHGTVRDNISLTKSNATIEEVVKAAKLAGADEFIERMPQGYDTMLEENGANLSGGQKQRLAIARTLITDPRILVFDEATSALDAESETIIQDNIKHISRDRTTFLISHRLSMLVEADVILVIEGGRIVAGGSHERLLDAESGSDIYRKLWYNQNKHLLDRP
jgi:ATP-binding cassette subfamily B protein